MMMKVLFEVDFKVSDMASKKEIAEEFGGSILNLMKWLYKNEGIGIFKNDLKLTGIK
jgi:hypothetical protein